MNVHIMLVVMLLSFFIFIDGHVYEKCGENEEYKCGGSEEYCPKLKESERWYKYPPYPNKECKCVCKQGCYRDESSNKCVEKCPCPKGFEFKVSSNCESSCKSYLCKEPKSAGCYCPYEQCYDGKECVSKEVKTTKSPKNC
ncbi:hypothetical protein GWI33_021597 [Rhynchophorus ferrugineus]|uniref:Uncharacterized protein n=1 Tax=Rhynchophorus ferrugineus TaxID=354439 RepID=A0A834I131_RHYFE|nr:hypothetical protein GWI33_021597 [Rhynchophorus ferrugineus]